MRILGDWNWWPGGRKSVFRATGKGANDDGKLLTGIVLACLAQRAKSANGASPHLLQALSGRVEPDEDAPASQHARALQASEEILKPLALTLLLDYLLKKSKQTTA
jgi:hypothetical protein